MSTLSRKSQSSLAVIAALLVGAMAQPVAAIEEALSPLRPPRTSTASVRQTPAIRILLSAQIACTAFIEATIQYHDAVSDRKQLKRLTCYPQGATIADGQKAFVAWGAQNAGNAKRMGELPVVGLIRALAKAYPCK